MPARACGWLRASSHWITASTCGSISTSTASIAMGRNYKITAHQMPRRIILTARQGSRSLTISAHPFHCSKNTSRKCLGGTNREASDYSSLSILRHLKSCCELALFFQHPALLEYERAISQWLRQSHLFATNNHVD